MRLRARAEESKGCGPKAIVFLAISVFLEFGALLSAIDVLLILEVPLVGMIRAVNGRWRDSSWTAIVFGFHLVVTVLPVVYAIKLHFKVVELITYLKNEGDIEANAATITASASPVPQNTAAQTGVQMEVRDLSCELGEQPQVLAVC